MNPAETSEDDAFSPTRVNTNMAPLKFGLSFNKNLDESMYEDMGSQNIHTSFSKVKLISTKPGKYGTDMSLDADDRLQSEGLQQSSNRRIFKNG